MGKKSSSAGRRKKNDTISSDDALSESHTIADSYSIASSSVGAALGMADDGDNEYGMKCAFQSVVVWIESAHQMNLFI
jgi:hypothetical protein